MRNLCKAKFIRLSTQKENMDREVEQPNVSVPRDSKARGTPEGLDAEVRNLSNEVPESSKGLSSPGIHKLNYEAQQGPHSATSDQSGNDEASHTNEGPATEHASELHEARVLRAFDEAGINGASGFNPKALVRALREEGVHTEGRISQDGQVGEIYIFQPDGGLSILLFGRKNGGKQQS
jgi:hypothetical protein